MKHVIDNIANTAAISFVAIISFAIVAKRLIAERISHKNIA